MCPVSKNTHVRNTFILHCSVLYQRKSLDLAYRVPSVKQKYLTHRVPSFIVDQFYSGL